MIEPMKYINITGQLDDIDRVIEKYISRYNIQLERADKEIQGSTSLAKGVNPYADLLQRTELFIKYAETAEPFYYPMQTEEAVEILEKSYKIYDSIQTQLSELKQRKQSITELIDQIIPFVNMDFDFKRLIEMEYIKFRFGRMPLTNYRQFEAFLYDDPEILFVMSKNDGTYVWGVYFAPGELINKIDSVFSSFHFERVRLLYELDGEILGYTPLEVLGKLREHLTNVNAQINEISIQMESNLPNKKDVYSAYLRLKILFDNYELRKYAVKTAKDFYIFVGWMVAKDAFDLQKEIEGDDKVVFIIEEESAALFTRPPTKLKNFPLFKPFELFVKMYGLPSYNEVDPTPFVALTYTILFGLMFGDVGQGLVIGILGYLLSRFKKMPLGKVLTVLGGSSIFFGFMYGSVFGFEELIPALLARPAENMMGCLIIGICIGIILTLVSMLINVLNAFKQKKLSSVLFSPNGVVGIVFYVALLFVLATTLLYGAKISTFLFFVFIILPLGLIALREPIEKYISGQKKLIDEGVGLFVLQTIIELFEVLLTYFTNTVSFVRVGAFALSHAGMMSVVLLLSHTSQDSNNLLVIILGNVLVIALEGLVVGIQVLRLEFYEMFSRYFDGTGREFVSYKEMQAH